MEFTLNVLKIKLVLIRNKILVSSFKIFRAVEQKYFQEIIFKKIYFRIICERLIKRIFIS